MKKVLGIDTGGTYTDGVIIQMGQNSILAKTKTLTTRHNLHLCIKDCMGAFSANELEGVSLVCLSTTLATNAIIEGRGCNEGLIMIGGRPEGKMPAGQYRIVRGRLDIMGRIREPIDAQEVDEAIEAFRGKVDAIAVSGYASVRNPAHEAYVKDRICKKLGIPVVCAHELTTSLGYYDRTVTAVLNARLIPVICRLIDAVKISMEEHKMNAPLMIVRGDGTLMTEACARNNPIETILSGSAASVRGSIFLSGEKDAIVLDMGGTTTDFAHIVDGTMQINHEGAKVGGWFTRVRAAKTYTVGLGGDSRIRLGSNGTVSIGPQKVIAYCMAGTWFPGLKEELRSIYGAEGKPHLHFWRGEADAFMLMRDVDIAERTEEEREVIEAIRAAPHTMYVLQNKSRVVHLQQILEKLLRDDVIGRIALTPTDILHASGEYIRWDAETSKLYVQIMADQMGMSMEDCISHVRKVTQQRVNCECLHSSFYDDNADLEQDAPQAIDYLINHIYLNNKSHVLGGRLFLKKPVVAIGAPARAWTCGLADALGTRVVVPRHAEVANAVGAAVGQAIENAEVLIRFNQLAKTYTLFSAKGRLSFADLEQATEKAKELGRALAAARLPSDPYDVSYEVSDTHVEDRFLGEKRFIERRVGITLVSQFMR